MVTGGAGEKVRAFTEMIPEGVQSIVMDPNPSVKTHAGIAGIIMNYGADKEVSIDAEGLTFSGKRGHLFIQETKGGFALTTTAATNTARTTVAPSGVTTIKKK